MTGPRWLLKRTADEVITYGAPVLPGAMFMLAYCRREGQEDIPIMGLPGCVMYAKRTIFDLVLPRIVAGEKLSEDDFYKDGRGRSLPFLSGMHLPKLRVREINFILFDHV